jgi:hypothetical protein
MAGFLKGRTIGIPWNPAGKSLAHRDGLFGLGESACLRMAALIYLARHLVR